MYADPAPNARISIHTIPKVSSLQNAAIVIRPETITMHKITINIDKTDTLNYRRCHVSHQIQLTRIADDILYILNVSE